MEQIKIIPEKGQRNNDVAGVMKGLGVFVWITGACLGAYCGYKVGELRGYYGNSDFDWRTAAIIWGAAFIGGLFPFAFSEIIYLLQSINDSTYRIVGLDKVLPMKTKLLGYDSEGSNPCDKEESTEEKPRNKSERMNKNDDAKSSEQMRESVEAFEVEAFMNDIERMSTVNEILEYAVALKESDSPLVSEGLMNIIYRNVSSELSENDKYKRCVKSISIFLKYGKTAEDVSKRHTESFEDKVEDDELKTNKTSQSISSAISDVSSEKMVSEQQEQDYVFCTMCGRKIEESDALFCPSCGTTVSR